MALINRADQPIVLVFIMEQSNINKKLLTFNKNARNIVSNKFRT